MTKEKNMKVWIIQPGVAPYRIPLFSKIHDDENIDLTVVLLCEHVPFQPWRIDRKSLPFKTVMAEGLNKVVKDERVVHDREVQFSFPLIPMLFKERPDVVVCSGFMLSTLLVYFVSKITGIRYVIWNEGTKYTDNDLPYIKCYLRKLMAKSASNFIIAGSLAKEYVQSLMPNRKKDYFLSCNCVDNKHFSVDETNEDYIKLKNKLPSRYLLFVGRFIETKGIKEMMQAYKEIVDIDEFSDLGLVLLGEGRLQEYIQSYSNENGLKNVYLEGFVDQKIIPYYYSAASSFVLLSLSDPNPLVIFEAMASGVPIICSQRAGNASDFIVDGENGYRVDPYNHDEVVSRIKMVLTDVDAENAKTVSAELLEKANYDVSAKAFLDSISAASK